MSKSVGFHTNFSSHRPNFKDVVGLDLWCCTIFNNISVYIVVSFIDGRNRNTRRKPPVASNWWILSHNVASSTPHHEQGSNSQC